MTTKPRVFANLNNIPTVKIIEILNSAPYYVTDKGTDYGPVADELQNILWERQAKAINHFKAIKGLMAVQAEAQDYELPPIPSECDEGLAAQFDYEDVPPEFSYCAVTGEVKTIHPVLPF